MKNINIADISNLYLDKYSDIGWFTENLLPEEHNSIASWRPALGKTVNAHFRLEKSERIALHWDYFLITPNQDLYVTLDGHKIYQTPSSLKPEQSGYSTVWLYADKGNHVLTFNFSTLRKPTVEGDSRPLSVAFTALSVTPEPIPGGLLGQSRDGIILSAIFCALFVVVFAYLLRPR